MVRLMPGYSADVLTGREATLTSPELRAVLFGTALGLTGYPARPWPGARALRTKNRRRNPGSIDKHHSGAKPFPLITPTLMSFQVLSPFGRIAVMRPKSISKQRACSILMHGVVRVLRIPCLDLSGRRYREITFDPKLPVLNIDW